MKKTVFALGVVAMTCGSPAGTDQINNPNDPNNPNNPNNPADPIASLDSSLKNGTRLRNKYIAASDGTVAMGSGLLDTSRNEDCSFAMADDGRMRCLPAYPNLAYASSYYNNATCSGTPVAYSSSCEPAKKYVIQNPANCGPSTGGGSVQPVTEITPPATLYTKGATACTSVANTFFTAAAGYRVYVIGSVIPASNFVDGAVMTQ